jgi:hypothetical protein
MAEELKEIKEAIEKLVEKYKDNFGFFICIREDSNKSTHFCGNECPVCIYEEIGEWIEDKNIQHSTKMSELKKVH